MHIVLLSLVFRPDSISTAHVMADLTADLVSAGSGRRLVTARDARATVSRRYDDVLRMSAT